MEATSLVDGSSALSTLYYTQMLHEAKHRPNPLILPAPLYQMDTLVKRHARIWQEPYLDTSSEYIEIQAHFWFRKDAPGIITFGRIKIRSSVIQACF